METLETPGTIIDAKALALQYLRKERQEKLLGNSGNLSNNCPETQGNSSGTISRPISTPVSRPESDQVAAVPADMPTDIRFAIGRLVAHCERWGDTAIADQIRNHPERWDDTRDESGALVIEGYGRQYLGMIHDMTDMHPDAANRIPEQAARAVCSWIEHRDLELISNQEYRDQLASCWDALRQPGRGKGAA